MGIMRAKDGTVFATTDEQAHRILTLSADGAVTTLAGSAEPGKADGRGEAARFSNPAALAEGPDGLLYVADLGKSLIRRVDREGNVTTVAGRRWRQGETQRPIDGDIAVARFWMPGSIAVASDGTIYVGEQKGRCVREIRNGVVSTLCRCDEFVLGLLLDELSGLLYVTAGKRILTIVVPTRADQLQIIFAPILRLGSLVRRERAAVVSAEASANPGETRAQEGLRRLLGCPVEIAVRALRFVY